VHFIESREAGGRVVTLVDVLRGHFAPGSVFKMDESALRQFLELAMDGPLRSVLRFNDTADTQTLVLTAEDVNPNLRLHASEEVAANV
jgi:hypothetical protein